MSAGDGVMFMVEPFIGPLPLRFGMVPEEVAALLGDAEQVFTDPVDGRSEARPGLSLGYEAERGLLSEAVFSSGELLFHGVNLFALNDLIGFLRQFDPSPQAAVGMIFFPRLGLRVSGFHDGDDDERAIGVSMAGRWDDFADEFVPYVG